MTFILYRHPQRVYKRLGTVESDQIKNQTDLDYKTKILAAKKEDCKKFCEEKASLDPCNTINKICKLKGSATPSSYFKTRWVDDRFT